MPAPAGQRAVEQQVQQPLWKQLLAADRPLTINELNDGLGLHPLSIDQRLNIWRRAGLVGRTGRRPHRYFMEASTERTSAPPRVNAPGIIKHREPAGYQRIWAAVRVLKHFDLPTLAIVSNVQGQALRSYIGVLSRVGYVRMTNLGNPRRGIVAQYSLVRDTGRTAPREALLVRDGTTVRQLVDANTGEQHDISTGAPSRRRSYRKPASDTLSDRGVS